ncbi:MAG: fibronectin type III domain-containing protein, partial [Bacteroidota bacterium]
LPETPVFVNTLDSLTISTDTFNLAWTTIQHAESYELRVLHTDSQFNHDTIVLSSGLTLRNLKNNHLYKVQVRASNERGHSEWSLPVYIKVVLPISSMSEIINDVDITIINNLIQVKSLRALPSKFQIISIDGSCKVSSTITELPYYFSIQELSRGFYFYTLGTLMQPFLIY